MTNEKRMTTVELIDEYSRVHAAARPGYRGGVLTAHGRLQGQIDRIVEELLRRADDGDTVALKWFD